MPGRLHHEPVPWGHAPFGSRPIPIAPPGFGNGAVVGVGPVHQGLHRFEKGVVDFGEAVLHARRHLRGDLARDEEQVAELKRRFPV